MKKILCWVLAGMLCVSLLGCNGKDIPAVAADGAAWDESWTTVGGVLGVETPGHGLTLRENNTALAGDDMFYATWSIGDAVPYTNEEGDEATLYDAELHLLLAGSRSQEKAQENAQTWMDMAKDRYHVTETSTETYNGQEFTVLIYTYSADTNPYAKGVCAIGVYGNYAINAELSCQSTYEGDASQVLADFLGCCHYGI